MRQYRVRAESREHGWDAGVIDANTRRSAIRIAQHLFCSLKKELGWERLVGDYFWPAVFERGA